MRRALLAAFVVGLLAAGCDPSVPGADDPTDPDDPPPQLPEFGFETCKTVQVTLRVEDQSGNPVPRAPVSVLSEHVSAFSGGTREGTILEGAPGNDGTVSALVSLPVTQEELVAQTTVTGSQQRERFGITEGRAQHTLVVGSASNANGTPGLTIHQPADNFRSTLVFEDLWPTEGDLDVNDVVVDYNFEMPATTTGQVTSFRAELITRATGSIFQNGFGFQMNVDPSLVSEVTGTELTGDATTTRPNGTEAGTDRAVIIAYDDAAALFGRRFVNTKAENPFVAPETLNVNVSFSQPVDTAALGTAPFNPFITAQNERFREVHLPNHEPTSRADRSLLDTGDDASNPSSGRFYLSSNNLPWALNLCNGFIYPRESIRIENTYLHFLDWLNSNGTEFQDWYTNTSAGYRETSNLYLKGLPR